MLEIDPEARSEVAGELSPGEHLLWAGRPAPGIRFRSEDAFLVPFSLLWGGMAIYMLVQVLKIGGMVDRPEPPFIFRIVPVAFVLVGQYYIWGRFVYGLWKKKHTYYAVTNRRVLVVRNIVKRHVATAFLDSLPSLILEGGRGSEGTLRFHETQPLFFRLGMGWDSMATGTNPVFFDVADVKELYRLILEQRERGQR